MSFFFLRDSLKIPQLRRFKFIPLNLYRIFFLVFTILERLFSKILYEFINILFGEFYFFFCLEEGGSRREGDS